MPYTEFKNGIRVSLPNREIKDNLREEHLFSASSFVEGFLKEIGFTEEQEHSFKNSKMPNTTIFKNDTDFKVLKGQKTIDLSVLEIKERYEYPQMGYMPFLSHELERLYDYEDFINHTLNILRETWK